MAHAGPLDQIGKPLRQQRLEGHDTSNADRGVCLDACPKGDGNVVKGEVVGVGCDSEHVCPDDGNETNTELLSVES